MNRIRGLFGASLLLPVVTLCSFPQAFAEEGGAVSSRECPYSCRTEGLPQDRCRDWREGDRCFIEDMRGAEPRGRPDDRSGADGAGAARCRSLSRYDVQSPRVEVVNIKPTGNVFEDNVRVEGAIEGACIQEAGYYEDGRLVERIPVQTTSDFQRFEFGVKAKRNRNPEVRVYNVFGARDTFNVAESLSHERGRGRYDDSSDRNGREPRDWSPIDELLGR